MCNITASIITIQIVLFVKYLNTFKGTKYISLTYKVFTILFKLHFILSSNIFFFQLNFFKNLYYF